MAAPVAILAKPDDHRGILTMRQGSMRLLRRFAIGRRTRWWQRCGGAAIGGPIYDKLSRRRKRLVLDFKPVNLRRDVDGGLGSIEFVIVVRRHCQHGRSVQLVGGGGKNCRCVHANPDCAAYRYDVLESVPHILSKKESSRRAP